MVIIIKVTTSAFLAGAIAKRCKQIPITPASNTARTMETGIGNPIPTNETVAIPPIIKNSPWAKLIT